MRSQKTSYQIENSTLIIKNGFGEIIWQGKPYGCPVVKIMPKPELSGCVVLLGYYEFGNSEYHYYSTFGSVIF